MKIVFPAIVVFSLIASGGIVLAHGEEHMGFGGPQTRAMLELMHEQMDHNRSAVCEEANDSIFIEKGEHMMETMMTTEQHERLEEEMEQISPEFHDRMHTLMGMWSTGCVGDEVMLGLADRYGYMSPNQKEGRLSGDTGLAFIIGGLIGGAVGAAFMSRRKSQNAPEQKTEDKKV